MSNADSTNQMLKLMTSSGLNVTDISTPASNQLVVDNYGEKKLQLKPSPSMADLLDLCLNPDKKHEATPT